MASPVYIWFKSEVSFWRSLASVCWSVICVPGILLGYLLLSNVSIFQPVEWIYGSVMSLFSLQVVFSIGVCSACLVLVTWFSLPHFSVVAEVESSQLASAVSLLRWSRLPLMVVSVVSGSISSWALARLGGESYQGLSRLVETETYARVVLNEQHLFLVLSGIITGVSYYTAFFRMRKYYLNFSHVQRNRLPQVRSELSSVTQHSSWQALNVLKYLYLTYFLFGSFPKGWIEASFKLSNDPQSVPINSIYGLFDLTLLWQTFLCTSCITFTWTLAAVLVRVFYTEPMTFPVQSDLDADKDKTLADAMACSYCPLLQHLALYDLHKLAHYSVERRLALLSLSQPGGHPRTWAAVSGQAMAIIGELCERVKVENWAILSKVTAPQSGSAASQRNGDLQARNGNTNFVFRRNETQNQGDIVDQAQKETETFVSKAMGVAKSVPFISHLLTESPEYNSRILFSSCQPQIWAVDGLSEVAAKAFTEDKYGVVQTMLPAVIGALLDLHEVLEKHMKLTAGVARKTNSLTEGPPDVLLKQKLFSFNKAAIYRIVNTYREHLSDLRLDMEHAKKLQPFTEYLV